MILPKVYSRDINNRDRKIKKEINATSGVFYSDRYSDGALEESENVSLRRYPYITNRRDRQDIGLSNVTSLFAWEKMVYVKEKTHYDELYYDNNKVGNLTKQTKERQFAVINTKMVIFPDKVYIDLSLPTAIHSLGETISITGATFGTTYINRPSLEVGTLKKGDAVFITGCTTHPNNNHESDALIIKSITTSRITFEGEAIFETGNESGTIVLERRIPDLDYICESENRIWGCSNETKTVMACALGDPTVWYDYSGESTDSYALAIGSEGEFTGCCKLSSSILFWKNRTLHKILGSYPAEYTLYSYTIEGVSSGSYKSMQVINEVLYYLGSNGVYSYSGGNTSRISTPLGDHNYTNGVGGTDGNSYYLSCEKDGVPVLLYFDLKTGYWMREDDTVVKQFCRIDNDLYFLTNGGKVFIEDNGQEESDIKWMAQYKPFYETIEGRKSYSKILMRMELPKGSYVEIFIRQDDGVWKKVMNVVGKGQCVNVSPIPISRCDKFELKLQGKGKFCIYSLMREYRVGSDV